MDMNSDFSAVEKYREKKNKNMIRASRKAKFAENRFFIAAIILKHAPNQMKPLIGIVRSLTYFSFMSAI